MAPTPTVTVGSSRGAPRRLTTSALWQLARTETTHRVYDAPKARGLTTVQVGGYVADTAAADINRDPPSGVEIRALDPVETRRFEGRYSVFSELRDDETAVYAFDTESGGRNDEGGRNGEVVDFDLVGYLFFDDPDLAYHIHPLEADMTFPDNYVR